MPSPAPTHSPRPQHRRSTGRGGRRRAARRRRPRYGLLAAVITCGALATSGLLLTHHHPTPARTVTVSGTAPLSSAAVSHPAQPIRITLALPATLTVPGSTDLEWPSSGQAAIAVQGLGLLGHSGPTSTPQPIASVTKTMTAYLILKDHPLSLIHI